MMTGKVASAVPLGWAVVTASQGLCFYPHWDILGPFNAKENNDTKQNKQITRKLFP